MELNTDNPEYITCQYEQLQIAILGGLKIEGLDRMRVTLKIEWKELAIRHNLDLYNDSALDKLVKKCAERFSLGTSYLVTVFATLINALEEHRLNALKKQVKNDSREPMVLGRRKEVEDFLQQPDLLSRTNDLIGQSGVIGEENNRLLMYLVFTSRKREQPLHIISLGSSGTGKSHLQEKVGELMPPEDKIEITALSENAFYYFGKQELKHKLILIEDLDGAQEVLYPLRELQSKKVINKTVVFKAANGETQTTTLRVEGPVCVGGCTTKESVYEDNANRSFLVYLDESQQQDNQIMGYQRKKSAGKINTMQENQVKQFLQDVQRILQPVAVRNPYAEDLQLPATVFKPRRTNAHYLAFVEVVTFYHQFQRKQQVDQTTGEVYIETTLEDIQEANQLMGEILLRKSDDLPGACRSYFEGLKRCLTDSAINTFTNRQISKALHMPISTVKRHNFALLNAGLIKRVVDEQDNKQFKYAVAGEESYQELQQQISSMLDKVLLDLQAKQPKGSVPAQQGSEPVKRRPVKEKKASAQ
jgi:predicted transcriptional regulator